MQAPPAGLGRAPLPNGFGYVSGLKRKPFVCLIIILGEVNFEIVFD